MLHVSLNGVILERVEDGSLVLNVGEGLGVGDELEEALFAVGADDLVGRHGQVQVVVQPDLVHNVDNLQCQYVLPQVISILKDRHNLVSPRLLVEGCEAHRYFLRGEHRQLLEFEVPDHYLRVDRKRKQQRQLLPLRSEVFSGDFFDLSERDLGDVPVAHDVLGDGPQGLVHLVLDPNLFLELPTQHQELLEQDVVALVGGLQVEVGLQRPVERLPHHVRVPQ
mmetsp:Transcript_28356/g.27301  ORF Transcript_28356/g.27301 Transcript_28356/m.27301 type:complete len:223 (+) Transcript_28356:756-1424(+)